MANQKIVTDEALSAFASDVKAAIANVSSPLVYKGTLGTGGTISTLPAASASNNGFAYVVITAGTYQGVVCAVSDVIASNGTAWNKIPQANSAETLPITTGSAVNTKSYIDTKTTFVKSASGSLVHIEDGADNIPVKSLVSEIVAVESGSGAKSPTNPYTISGFASGIVTRCGKNLFNSALKQGTINSTTGSINPSTNRCVNTDLIPIPQDVSRLSSNKKIYEVAYFDKAKNFITTGYFNTNVAVLNTSYAYFRISIRNEDNSTILPSDIEIQLELGNQVTTYEAYNGNTYTFAFGQKVYGGYFDNKGNLVVTHGIADLGSVTWQYNSPYSIFYTTDINGIDYGAPFICEIYTDAGPVSISSLGNYSGELRAEALYIKNTDYGSDTNAFKTAMNGIMLVRELANPITLSITSQDIPTLLGENNIFSNCGDVEVNYYTSKSNDILEFIDSEIGKKNGDNIPIEENSQDSIKDYVDDEVSTINISLSNKASKTEDTTITLASGYSLISSSCGKTDRLVHLNFNVEKTGGFATGWQAVGTTDFKPNTLVYCPLWNVTNGVGNGEVRIDTDGTINFYVVTAGEVRLNANIGYVTS